jgi:multidrug resistance efflux pump
MNNEPEEKELSDDKLAAATATTIFRQRSELAQEIVSSKHGFLENWALPIFLGLLLSLVAATWFIKYPDIVETRAVLVPHHAPKELVSPLGGRIANQLVPNHTPVKKGQPVIFLEDSVGVTQIMVLNKYVNKFLLKTGVGELSGTEAFFKLKVDSLGEIAPAYQNLLAAFKSRDAVKLRQSLTIVSALTKGWLDAHIIRATIDGTLIFSIPVSKDDYLPPNKVIGYISPPQNSFYVSTVLSQYNFGKLDTGLLVQLRFNAYPYQEMGYVEGRLNYISEFPTDTGFMATIALPKGLITNNNFKITYRGGLTAQALIITKNMRLLQRIYYSVVKTGSY